MIPYLHIGIAFSLLTIVFLLTRRPLGIGDKIAMMILVFHSIPMLIKLILPEISYTNLAGGFFQTWLFPYPFTYGPLLYLYIKMQIDASPGINKKFLIHFVPFILLTLMSFITTNNTPVFHPEFNNDFNGYQDMMFPFSDLFHATQPGSPPPPDFLFPKFEMSMNPADFLYLFLLNSSFIFYTVLILWYLYKNDALHKYRKLKILTLFSMLSYSVILFPFVIPESWWNPLFNMKIITEITNTCFIFVFCSISLQQAVKNYYNIQNTGAEKISGKKYKKSGLKPEIAKRLIADLEKYMKEEKPYLDSDLTIDDVTLRLGTHKYYLSQVLNEYIQKSFSTYINEYRIEEAKQMLLDSDSGQSNKNFAVIDIAFEAGFNSKSMFNLAFKKLTGITPSEYKRKSSSGIMDRKDTTIKINNGMSDFPSRHREY